MLSTEGTNLFPLKGEDKAALKTSVQGGFTPQVEQGAVGVRSFAEDGSKLEGTGFEYVQIGHIQLKFFTALNSEVD